MLIRFEVGNYRSIWEPVELSMVAVDRGRVEASLALLPLLRGEVVFRSIGIDGADILLERLPDGTPNWDLRPPARGAAAPARAQLRPGATSPPPRHRHRGRPPSVRLRACLPSSRKARGS